MAVLPNSMRGDEKPVMLCWMCKSETQVEFVAEINIHFSGLETIDNPGVLLFSNLLICLNCGLSWFSVPKTELTLLLKGIPSGKAEA